MYYRIAIAALAVMFCLQPQPGLAEDDEQRKIPTELRETFDKSFFTVWKCVKQTITDRGCLIERAKPVEMDDGTYKGKISSTFCVLHSGEDGVLDTLKEYAVRVPYIRAGYWTSARIQYIFYVTEKEDGSVNVRLKGEISGYEEYVTHKFHYFASNFLLEEKIMADVKRLIAESNDEDEEEGDD